MLGEDVLDGLGQVGAQQTSELRGELAGVLPNAILARATHGHRLAPAGGGVKKSAAERGIRGDQAEGRP